MAQSERVQQILEVLGGVRSAEPAAIKDVTTARRRAAKVVASRRNIDERTTTDKCCRGLRREGEKAFHIAEFDALVWDWLRGASDELHDRCMSASGNDDDRTAIAEFFSTQRAEPTRHRIRAESARGQQLVEHVWQTLTAEGLNFSKEQVADFYLAVRTKPFVLLAGISGTGKSVLARRFAAACGFPAPLIAVRPDWSDPSELLGYRDLEGAFVPGRLIPHLVAASERPERPYFVILDEMNLARVEHYYADLLSIMETRRRAGDQVVTDALDLDIGPETRLRCEAALASRLNTLLADRELTIPSNLCVIGTVNMDESTHPFSKKVLDRAMTLEFVEVDLRAVPTLQRPPPTMQVESGELDAPVLSLSQVYSGREALFQPAIELLVALNEQLAQASMQVGYRTRDEVCIFLFHNAEQALLDPQVALDLAIYHKVLPRVQGGEEVRDLLAAIRQLMSAQNLPRCVRKLDEMQQRLERAGFTAFWA